MNPRTVGWSLVALQFVLLGALIVLPRRDDWSTPPVVEIVGWMLIAAGVVVALAATRRLGSALTPTPEPLPDERLRTDGLYGHVRHPIYSGILLGVVGLVLRSGSWITLAFGIATIAFFTGKSMWEERRLAIRYPDYAAYAARVGRFVPKPRRA